jgi:flagellar basal body rod protein FlgG
MSDGIYVALSGAIAQTTSLDATATNLANASTDGYQRVRSVFREVMAGATSSGATPPVTTATSSLDTSPGALRVTGNALDVALPDQSYLAVSTPRGERYTRAGALALGADGTLTMQHGGHPLVGEDGKPIRAKRDGADVKLTPSGEVWQGDTQLGHMRMVTFSSPDKLAPEGGALLNATAAGAATPAKGELSIGSLEGSNTSVVGMMTDLVTASRTFDAFQRAMDAFHDADQKAVTSVAGDP